MGKQTYKYNKENSILGAAEDEYQLSKDEYCGLYSFYVTYSMCGNQSAKKRTFTDYGWPNDSIRNTDLGNALRAVLNLNNNQEFIFTDKNDLSEKFRTHNMSDGEIGNLDYERAVLVHNGANNHYLRLFYRVRDGFAHGKYKLRYSNEGERMVVIQDNDQHNVTARIVIRLNTLLEFINVIDLNRIIDFQ